MFDNVQFSVRSNQWESRYPICTDAHLTYVFVIDRSSSSSGTDTLATAKENAKSMIRDIVRDAVRDAPKKGHFGAYETTAAITRIVVYSFDEMEANEDGLQMVGNITIDEQPSRATFVDGFLSDLEASITAITRSQASVRRATSMGKAMLAIAEEEGPAVDGKLTITILGDGDPDEVDESDDEFLSLVGAFNSKLAERAAETCVFYRNTGGSVGPGRLASYNHSAHRCGENSTLRGNHQLRMLEPQIMNTPFAEQWAWGDASVAQGKAVYSDCVHHPDDCYCGTYPCESDDRNVNGRFTQCDYESRAPKEGFWHNSGARGNWHASDHSTLTTTATSTTTPTVTMETSTLSPTTTMTTSPTTTTTPTTTFLPTCGCDECFECIETWTCQTAAAFTGDYFENRPIEHSLDQTYRFAKFLSGVFDANSESLQEECEQCDRNRHRRATNELAYSECPAALLDVRSVDEFANEHVPCAVHVTYSKEGVKGFLNSSLFQGKHARYIMYGNTQDSLNRSGYDLTNVVWAGSYKDNKDALNALCARCTLGEPRSVVLPPEDCCDNLTASCLACRAGFSIQHYCSVLPDFAGCEGIDTLWVLRRGRAGGEFGLAQYYRAERISRNGGIERVVDQALYSTGGSAEYTVRTPARRGSNWKVSFSVIVEPGHTFPGLIVKWMTDSGTATGSSSLLRSHTYNKGEFTAPQTGSVATVVDLELELAVPTTWPWSLERDNFPRETREIPLRLEFEFPSQSPNETSLETEVLMLDDVQICNNDEPCKPMYPQRGCAEHEVILVVASTTVIGHDEAVNRAVRTLDYLLEDWYDNHTSAEECCLNIWISGYYYYNGQLRHHISGPDKSERVFFDGKEKTKAALIAQFEAYRHQGTKITNTGSGIGAAMVKLSDKTSFNTKLGGKLNAKTVLVFTEARNRAENVTEFEALMQTFQQKYPAGSIADHICLEIYQGNEVNGSEAFAGFRNYSTAGCGDSFAPFPSKADDCGQALYDYHPPNCDCRFELTAEQCCRHCAPVQTTLTTTPTITPETTPTTTPTRTTSTTPTSTVTTTSYFTSTTASVPRCQCNECLECNTEKECPELANWDFQADFIFDDTADSDDFFELRRVGTPSGWSPYFVGNRDQKFPERLWPMYSGTTYYAKAGRVLDAQKHHKAGYIIRGGLQQTTTLEIIKDAHYSIEVAFPREETDEQLEFSGCKVVALVGAEVLAELDVTPSDIVWGPGAKPTVTLEFVSRRKILKPLTVAIQRTSYAEGTVLLIDDVKVCMTPHECVPEYPKCEPASANYIGLLDVSGTMAEKQASLNAAKQALQELVSIAQDHQPKVEDDRGLLVAAQHNISRSELNLNRAHEYFDAIPYVSSPSQLGFDECAEEDAVDARQIAISRCANNSRCHMITLSGDKYHLFCRGHRDRRAGDAVDPVCPLVMLDARSRAEFEAGHASCATPFKFGGNETEEAALALAGVAGKNGRFITYGNSTAQGTGAQKELELRGFTNVKNGYSYDSHKVSLEIACGECEHSNAEVCCTGMKAECLSCQVGQELEQFCQAWPNIPGCSVAPDVYLTDSSGVNCPVTIIDVRSKQEFDTSRPPCAVHIPLEDIVTSNRRFLMETVGGLAGTVVVYCNRGILSSTAKSRLLRMGFTNVSASKYEALEDVKRLDRLCERCTIYVKRQGYMMPDGSVRYIRNDVPKTSPNYYVTLYMFSTGTPTQIYPPPKNGARNFRLTQTSFTKMDEYLNNTWFMLELGKTIPLNAGTTIGQSLEAILPDPHPSGHKGPPQWPGDQKMTLIGLFSDGDRSQWEDDSSFEFYASKFAARIRDEHKHTCTEAFAVHTTPCSDVSHAGHIRLEAFVSLGSTCTSNTMCLDSDRVDNRMETVTGRKMHADAVHNCMTMRLDTCVFHCDDGYCPIRDDDFEECCEETCYPAFTETTTHTTTTTMTTTKTTTQTSTPTITTTLTSSVTTTFTTSLPTCECSECFQCDCKLDCDTWALCDHDFEQTLIIEGGSAAFYNFSSNCWHTDGKDVEALVVKSSGGQGGTSNQALVLTMKSSVEQTVPVGNIDHGDVFTLTATLILDEIDNSRIGAPSNAARFAKQSLELVVNGTVVTQRVWNRDYLRLDERHTRSNVEVELVFTALRDYPGELTVRYSNLEEEGYIAMIDDMYICTRSRGCANLYPASEQAEVNIVLMLDISGSIDSVDAVRKHAQEVVKKLCRSVGEDAGKSQCHNRMLSTTTLTLCSFHEGCAQCAKVKESMRSCTLSWAIEQFISTLEEQITEICLNAPINAGTTIGRAMDCLTEMDLFSDLWRSGADLTSVILLSDGDPDRVFENPAEFKAAMDNFYKDATLQCAADQWMCKSGVQCISSDEVCEGEKGLYFQGEGSYEDCDDGSDEAQYTCTPHIFRPPEVSTITAGITEAAVITSAEKPCAIHEFACGAVLDAGNLKPIKCLPSHWQCDSYVDCEDESDEQECDNLHPSFEVLRAHCDEHPDQYFRCKTGANRYCIPLAYKCDGHNDCYDEEAQPGLPGGSDESDATCIAQDASEVKMNRYRCPPLARVTRL